VCRSFRICGKNDKPGAIAPASGACAGLGGSAAATVRQFVELNVLHISISLFL